MSNEEQAVLEFFTLKENLPLALSVAEQVDELRQHMNNAFWRDLHERMERLVREHNLPWSIVLTEDRNAEGCVVGLHLDPLSNQPLFLRLMMEQQYVESAMRIYYGVMWNMAPATDRMKLGQVSALRVALLDEGFKNNDNFLAWNWSPYFPRRRDFLQRYSDAPEELLAEVSGLLNNLLLTKKDALLTANTALREIPPGVIVSLDQLRVKVKDYLKQPDNFGLS